MTDTRRVCDLSAAELFAVLLASLRMDAGEWDIKVRAVDGKPRRVHGTMVEAAPLGTTFGYGQLEALRP